jgi:curved DNA-binding protein CbpA
MSNSGGIIRGSAPLNTGKLISSYYLEIDYLLERVEGATTHYQTLGIERSANADDVVVAYQKSVAVLHPSYHKVRATVPDEMLVRVDHAFKKLSEAFSVLTSSTKRTQYDEQRNPRTYATVPLEVPQPAAELRPGIAESKTEAKAEPRSRNAQPKTEPKTEPRRGKTGPKTEPSKKQHAKVASIDINVAQEMRPVFTKASVQQGSVERRRCERFKLTVPVLVAGYDHTGKKWQEVSKTIDVSRIGVAVRLRTPLKHGLVVHITLPLPTKLRSHGFAEAGYNMYAIVRRIEPIADGMRVVGLEFIGASPPTDFIYKPWATFRTQKWVGPDRRREPREERIEPVAVEYLDGSMQRLGREAAVTENVSPNGVRVCVRTSPAEFEYVRITSPNRTFSSLALVRNHWSGTDGFDRLCLQFVENTWPL